MRLVEMHGGSVTVESEVDEGSRFFVSLPWIGQKREVAADEGEGQVATEYALLSASTNSRPGQTAEAPLILLTEDNESSIEMIGDYLQELGYRVVVARNGAEAVDRAREMLPDMILMDIQMPVMDGMEATRRIRQERETAHIPIIALTALAMRGDHERCLEAGVDEYMSKPVRLRELASTIKSRLLRLEEREQQKRHL